MGTGSRIELIRNDIEIANERDVVGGLEDPNSFSDLQRSLINDELIWALGGLEILARFAKYDNDCLGDDKCKCGLIKILEEIGIK